MKIQRKQSQAEVPSMAMGDIAFNLLIFFVILAKAQDDSHLQWEPASAQKLTPAGYATVSIVIDHENKLYLNGQQTGLSSLEGGITSVLGDAPAGKRTVLLKVHKDAIHRIFAPVIEAISKAGGELVHIVEDDSKKT